jgi:predicted small secreted protein
MKKSISILSVLLLLFAISGCKKTGSGSGIQVTPATLPAMAVQSLQKPVFVTVQQAELIHQKTKRPTIPFPETFLFH